MFSVGYQIGTDLLAILASTTTAQKKGNGTFYHNSRVSFRDMRDGTSNTMVVGERAMKNVQVALSTPQTREDYYSTWVGNVAANGSTDTYGPARCVGVAITSPNSEDVIEKDYQTGFGSPHPGGGTVPYRRRFGALGKRRHRTKHLSGDLHGQRGRAGQPLLCRRRIIAALRVSNNIYC